MMPSGHKAFLVHNPRDVDLLLMHNRTYAAEYVPVISSSSAPIRIHSVVEFP
jgi:large subunit ribosomal protein L32e